MAPDPTPDNADDRAAFEDALAYTEAAPESPQRLNREQRRLLRRNTADQAKVARGQVKRRERGRPGR